MKICAILRYFTARLKGLKMKLRDWINITECEKDREAMRRTLPGALASALDNVLYSSSRIKGENEYNDGHFQLPGKAYIGFEFAKQNNGERMDGSKFQVIKWEGLEDNSQYCTAEGLLNEIYMYLKAVALKEVRGK